MSPVALVTGGGTGIGAACCRALAGAGFRVAVHHRTSGTTAERIAADLPDAFTVRADLAVPTEVEALMGVLGGVPLDVTVRQGGDVGVPAVAQREPGPAARALTSIAGTVAARMSVRAAQAASQPVLTVS